MCFSWTPCITLTGGYPQDCNPAPPQTFTLSGQTPGSKSTHARMWHWFVLPLPRLPPLPSPHRDAFDWRRALVTPGCGPSIPPEAVFVLLPTPLWVCMRRRAAGRRRCASPSLSVRASFHDAPENGAGSRADFSFQRSPRVSASALFKSGFSAPDDHRASPGLVPVSGASRCDDCLMMSLLWSPPCCSCCVAHLKVRDLTNLECCCISSCWVQSGEPHADGAVRGAAKLSPTLQHLFPRCVKPSVPDTPGQLSDLPPPLTRQGSFENGTESYVASILIVQSLLPVGAWRGAARRWPWHPAKWRSTLLPRWRRTRRVRRLRFWRPPTSTPWPPRT